MTEANISQILRTLPRDTQTFMACFFTGASLPSFVEPMPRVPAPSVGFDFDETFANLWQAALNTNEAIHDGAVVVGRTKTTATYQVIAWSCRLFPPPLLVQAAPNKGSAYNSCLAMSVVPTVDLLYLVSHSERIIFRVGRVIPDA